MDISVARMQATQRIERLTFDVRGGRSRRRREAQAQLADVPLDGIVRTGRHLKSRTLEGRLF